MKKINTSLSLIVPAFNEEEGIVETITMYHKELAMLFDKFEIIVVNDGSRDRTKAHLIKLKKTLPKITIINKPSNQGVGRAILDGFKIAKHEWVLANSADRPFSLLELPKIKSKFAEFDVIVVSRKDRSAHPHFRKITSLVSFYLVRLLFRVPILDFHFVQLYKRDIVKDIQITAHDTFALAELLVTLYQKGHRITHYPAHFYKRTKGTSKYNNPIRYAWYAKDLLTFWFRYTMKPKSKSQNSNNKSQINNNI